MNRKNIITILLVVALIAVIILSISNRSQHGDRAQWMKEHGVVAKRHPDVDRFCIDCHQKKLGQSKQWCNDCHSKTNIDPIK